MFTFDNDPDLDARCRRYRISGRLETGRFESFLRARATLLSLHVATLETRGGQVEAIMHGDPALLGMFEMADDVHALSVTAISGTLSPDMTTWHPVALGADIATASAAPARLDGAEIVLWRDSLGALHAWEDRCPHRGMRLSFGFVRNDRLACLYHGWQFDTAARCRHIPAHPDLSPPGTITARPFQVAESGALVWVADTTAAPPPEHPAAIPARSIAIAAPLATVTAALGIGPEPVMRRVGLTCALHPPDAQTTMLHVTVADPADAAPAALWSQRARDAIEAGEPVPMEPHP